VAELVRERCPNAWVINFTNPAGMITEAMQSVLGDRVIGICDSPMGLVNRALRALGAADAGAVRADNPGVGAIGAAVVDYAGLNHLGWLQGLHVDGTDRLPELLADGASLSATEEGQLFGVEWLRTLGAIPNEYLYYFYYTRDAIASITGGAATRGEFLLTQQGDFYRAAAAVPDEALSTWNHVHVERNSTYMREARADDNGRDTADIAHGGYERVATSLMTAIASGAPAELILNVANRATLPGLPPDAVIEVPCRVDADGAHPLAVSALTGHPLGLVQQIKAVERLTISAAREGSERLAVEAFALHPLVDSVTTARLLLAEYRRRIPDLDAVFAR
ncbi:MAG: 6-phospho-beta-glucosidase, partial [Ilumatobacteraceae bacterium]